MIKFNKDELRDKIYACWIGKNIGGTIGAKYECQHEMNDCKGFYTKPGEPLPNDDLDLQLVWLKAILENGIGNINSRLLGEYWLEYVTPCWNEYGICKANMKRGLTASVAGQYKNHWKHSNGAWIRTEIWACLCPGDVERASRLSYEDACVDHGVGEGTYAAIFVASMQAAAFVINDIRKVIEIGLSKIPEKSRMYKFIEKVIECYDNKVDWVDARNIITNMSLEDSELGWFQSPANVGYMVIGLLYGEGDFKRSMLMACNCGDDADCTSASLGALLGIMHGTKVIPDDWREHIGDSIVTISIDMGDIDPKERDRYMNSCVALTNTIMEVLPSSVLGTDIKISETEESDISGVDIDKYYGNDFAMYLTSRSEYFSEHESILAKCIIEYGKEPEIKEGESITLDISLASKFPAQKIFNIEWIVPEGLEVKGPKNIYALRPGNFSKEQYVVTANENIKDKNRLIMVVSCEGHFDTLMVPVIFMG